jgi:hypothetical protein
MTEIYLYNSLICDKQAAYVGSTTNSNQRHYRYSKGHFTQQKRFFHWANKYGLNNMLLTHIPMEEDITKQELLLWEQFYIKMFCSYIGENEEFGLNIIKNPNLNISKEDIIKKERRRRFLGELNPMFGRSIYRNGKNVEVYSIKNKKRNGAQWVFEIDEKIGEYISINECSRNTGIDKRSVQRILSGEKTFINNITIKYK